MNCQYFQAQLSDYYDEELSVDQRLEFEQHIETCDACQCALCDYRELSSLMRSTELVSPQSWQSILAKLESGSGDQATMDRPLVDASGVEAAKWTNVVTEPGDDRSGMNWQKWAAIGLALAASVLVLVWPKLTHDAQDVANTSPLVTSSIAIDFSDVINKLVDQPALAFETLSRNYEGQEVSAVEARKLLGYEPTILRALPRDTQLVSSRVLKLPVCTCKDGQCQCGPGGCNCSVCLCQRKDGSQFVLIEHCDSQQVTFASVLTKEVQEGARRFKIMGQGNHLAASWSIDNHRLTAIGIRDEAEAAQLISVADKLKQPVSS